jgi:hypothetical protein
MGDSARVRVREGLTRLAVAHDLEGRQHADAPQLAHDGGVSEGFLRSFEEIGARGSSILDEVLALQDRQARRALRASRAR